MFGNPVTKVIDGLKKHLTQLHSQKEEDQLKAKQKLSQDIFKIHFYLYGDADNEPRTDLIKPLVEKLLGVDDDLFMKLAQNIELFDFEAKKHTAGIMNYIIRRCTKNNVHKYIKSKTDPNTHHNVIIDCLLKGYHDQHLAQNVGSVLQEMAKRNEIAPHILLEVQLTRNAFSIADEKLFNNSRQSANTNTNTTTNTNTMTIPIPGSKKTSLTKPGTATDTGAATTTTTPAIEDRPESKSDPNNNNNNNNNNSNNADDAWDIVDELFLLVRKPSFDIASDAFKTLNLLFTRNKKKVAVWLSKHYARFACKFNLLIQSDNYVTQRQFLALLSEILMEKLNFSIMIRYIGDKENLKIAMTLIKNESKAISHEAFHIFKIFVANPKKTRDIQIILYKNREKLILFLDSFLVERTLEDELFADEKAHCIGHLQSMPMPAEIAQHMERKRERSKSRAKTAVVAAAAAAAAAAVAADNATGGHPTPGADNSVNTETAPTADADADTDTDTTTTTITAAASTDVVVADDANANANAIANTEDPTGSTVLPADDATEAEAEAAVATNDEAAAQRASD